MISRTTKKFRILFLALTEQVKVQANDAYKQFKRDPYHPSLHFKRVHSTKPIYSARINLDYRTVGIIQNDQIIWFWIGSHQAYETLLKRI